MANDVAEIFKMVSVSKRFPGVKALENVKTFSKKGEICALFFFTSWGGD